MGAGMFSCAEDVETLLVGQRVQYAERINSKSNKLEAVAVELA